MWYVVGATSCLPFPAQFPPRKHWVRSRSAPDTGPLVIITVPFCLPPSTGTVLYVVYVAWQCHGLPPPDWLYYVCIVQSAAVAEPGIPQQLLLRTERPRTHCAKSNMLPRGLGRPGPSPRPAIPAESQSSSPPKRLRSACDSCHRAKVRCSGGKPCTGCADSKHQCCYSVPNRIGRPRGTRNKKTLLRLGEPQSALIDPGPSTFDNLTTRNSDSQPVSYFTTSPDSPPWDIGYDFTGDVALETGRRSFDVCPCFPSRPPTDIC